MSAEKFKAQAVMLNDMVSKLDNVKYYYMDTFSYAQSVLNDLTDGDISKSMQIYWREILLRVHFTALTSVLRNSKWINGIIFGIESSNLMIFSASLRGFLEAVSDTYYSLESIPTDLALNHKNINQAVKGELNRNFTSEQTENKLLHFEFASKRSNIKPLTNINYIKYFDMLGEIKAKDLYSELCDITHPSSKSILCFTSNEILSDHFEYISINNAMDNNEIQKIINKYDNAINTLLIASINLPFLCFKVLNLFEYDQIKSVFLETCVINKFIKNKVWNDILKMTREGEKYTLTSSDYA